MKRLLLVAGVVVGILVAGLAAGAYLEDQARRAALAAEPGFAVDRVLVEKGARRMTLLHQGRPVRRYRVALGFAPRGPKRREGDGRTPEGVYRIDWRKPDSAFHLSLHVSYPDAQDRARAAARGEPPGGAIFIHGERNRIGWLLGWATRAGLLDRGDWTDGCIAVTNPEIREIWANVKTGTPIEIRP